VEKKSTKERKKKTKPTDKKTHNDDEILVGKRVSICPAKPKGPIFQVFKDRKKKS